MTSWVMRSPAGFVSIIGRSSDSFSIPEEEYKLKLA